MEVVKDVNVEQVRVELIREMLIRLAAQVAHEVNKAYCESLGDTSQEPWDKAPQWQKDSVQKGASQILFDPATTPQQSHTLWMAHKLADGWKHGEKKDAEAKTHPCMVPYDRLPKEQQLKDALFGASVRAVFKGAGAW